MVPLIFIVLVTLDTDSEPFTLNVCAGLTKTETIGQGFVLWERSKANLARITLITNYMPPSKQIAVEG